MDDHVRCLEEFEHRGIVCNKYTTPPLLAKVEEFAFRVDDVVLATFPRSGTTMTQEMIWQIANHSIIEKDVKYPNVDDRFPFLEFNPEFFGPDEPNPIDTLAAMREKRLIKTHLPYRILRDQLEKVNPKLVVVMRNPKDTVTSLFHFYRLIHNFEWKGSWQDMLNIFLKGKTFSGDFFTNNLEWWSLRERDNVIVLKYEELLRRPLEEIDRLATFLGYHLSPRELDIVAHNTSFQVMQKNQNVNFSGKEDEGSFIRKGVCGAWKSSFSEAQSQLMDEHITERLKGSDLCFDYE